MKDEPSHSRRKYLVAALAVAIVALGSTLAVVISASSGPSIQDIARCKDAMSNDSVNGLLQWSLNRDTRPKPCRAFSDDTFNQVATEWVADLQATLAKNLADEQARQADAERKANQRAADATTKNCRDELTVLIDEGHGTVDITATIEQWKTVESSRPEVCRRLGTGFDLALARWIELPR